MKALILAVVFVFVAIPAAKANNIFCKERTEVVADLDKHYQENKTGGGLSSTGVMIEVFVSDKGSWTVLITRPDGLSCIASHGRHWLNTLPSDKKDKT